MPVVAPKPLAVEDYFQQDLDAEGRLELLNETLFDVAGAEPEHNQVKDNIARELGVRLTERGCRVATSDQRVRLEERTYVYPDVVVACDPVYADDEHPRALVNPEFVAEVTSPSTASRDHSEKLAAYARVEGLREYWIAESGRPLLTQCVRAGEAWRVRVIDDLGDTARSVHFDVEVPMTALYALVLEPEDAKNKDEAAS